MVALSKIGKIKVRASSLTEVLVATVIILIIFAIATTTLNNVFYHTVKNKRFLIETQLNQLVYEYQEGIIQLPYTYEEGDWLITTEKLTENNISIVLFEAKHKSNDKSITRKSLFKDAE